MNELMMFLSSAMPESFMIDELQKAIIEYKDTGEGKNKIRMFCSLLLSKELTDERGLEKSIEDMNRAKKAMDLMNITES